MTDLQSIAYSLKQISGVLWGMFGMIVGIWIMVMAALWKK